MIGLPANCPILIASKPVDMRKAHDGLAAIVQEQLGHQTRSGQLFVFFNKRANRVKILYWERNGYCLWYKRLENGKYCLPHIQKKSYKIDPSELNLLLEGIDLNTQRLRRFS